MLIAIDEEQPKSEQLGKDFLIAKIVPVSQLAVGDTVYLSDFTGKVEEHEIVGKVTTQTILKGIHHSPINGRKVLNTLYVDKYGTNASDNINNYLLAENYRVKSK